MSKKYRKMWVSEDFARQCKINAAKENKSMMKYTEDLAEQLGEDWKEMPIKKEKKGYSWKI